MSQALDHVSPQRDRLTFAGAITQTLAMFLDAYRELNAKKLFWITMVLSFFVVGVFGAVGFDERGFTILWKHFKSPFLNTNFLPIEQLYKNLFIALGVKWWLGFAAVILALISTAPMLPDFLSGGAVDLYLARPLGRVRLFLTKYVVGLLFVALQVLVFCVASFLVIGLRSGAWVPGIFLAVPVVVLLFSYLWSVCALVGTVTRSTIAALLLTMLAWFGIWCVQAAEGALLTFSTGSRIEGEALDRDIAKLEGNIAALEAKIAASTQPSNGDKGLVKNLQARLDLTRANRGNVNDPFDAWHRGVYAAYWPLPKTSETTSLMERWLDKQFRPDPRGRPQGDVAEDEPPSRSFFADQEVQRQTQIEVEAEMRSRSAVWVIGTSLGFEAVMLALATWVFVKRDF